MRKNILMILISFFSLKAACQSGNNSNSLKQIYISEKNDSLKIQKHLDYIEALFINNTPAKIILPEIELLKKEIVNKRNVEFILWTLYYEGAVEYDNNNYIKSIIAIEKMRPLWAQVNLSEKAKRAAASILITLGLDYSKLYDLENAQISYKKAIFELKAINDSFKIAHTYLNMGFLFIKTEDFVSAEKVFERGLQYLNNGSSREKYVAYLNSSLSLVHSKMGNQKEANLHLQLAADAKKNINDVVAANFYEHARGETEILKKNYLIAIDAFESALSFARQWGDTASVAEEYEGLGRAYGKLKNHKKALENLMASKKLAEEHKLLDQQKIVLKSLFELYKDGNFKEEAVATAESLFLLNDSLLSVQNINRLTIADALFESEQRAGQIEELQNENELSNLRLKQKSIITNILAGTAIIILMMSFLAYRNIQQKRKLQEQKISDLEKEKLLLATTSILKGQEAERSRLAKDLHDGLGGLLSGVKLQLGAMKGNIILSEQNGRIFNNALGKLDESISELRRVAHNMMPEALINLGLQQALQDYCDGLSESQPFTINTEFHGLEKRVAPTIEVVVYRIVQELLNNAVKHSGATIILAQVIRQGNNLTITVEDNGKGFDKESILQGNGLKNIRSRVDYLKGQMDIQSIPGNGSSIHIDCIINSNS